MAIAVVPDFELADQWPWATDGGGLWEGLPGDEEEPGRRPHLRLVDDRRVGPTAGEAPRPATTSRPRRRASARVRRRRLAAAAVITVVVLVATVPLGTLLGQAHAPTAGLAQPSVGGALAIDARGGQGTFYVVQPGDTLQSIAARIAPSDPAPVVRELSRLLGSDRVVAGEHIPLS